MSDRLKLLAEKLRQGSEAKAERRKLRPDLTKREVERPTRDDIPAIVLPASVQAVAHLARLNALFDERQGEIAACRADLKQIRQAVAEASGGGNIRGQLLLEWNRLQFEAIAEVDPQRRAALLAEAKDAKERADEAGDFQGQFILSQQERSEAMRRRVADIDAEIEQLSGPRKKGR